MEKADYVNKAGDKRGYDAITKNLIPCKKGSKEAVEIGRLGGITKTPAKKFAAQLREMKKKGDTNAQIKWFCQRLEDPEANILHIQQLLDNFISENPKEHNAVAAMNTQIALHKAHYGDKRINTNFNVNIDLNDYLDQLYEKRQNE